jgi:cytochrome c oxidase cbb3-type subunit 1
MMVATFYGLLGATELVAPDLTENMGGIVFGRVRPTHVNLVLFGFVTPGLLSAAFYFIPRIAAHQPVQRTPGRFHRGGLEPRPGRRGRHPGRRLYPGPGICRVDLALDIMVVAAFGLVFYNFIMTVKNRQEPILYVSVWYPGRHAS